MPRIPITEFTYDPVTRKFFRYGVEWKRAGVDALVDRVEHEGQLIRATEWLQDMAEWMGESFTSSPRISLFSAAHSAKPTPRKSARLWIWP